METIISFLSVDVLVQLALIIIAGASVLVRVLEFATGIKPSDRLDTYASGTKKFIAWLENVLDRLALNPRRDE